MITPSAKARNWRLLVEHVIHAAENIDVVAKVKTENQIHIGIGIGIGIQAIHLVGEGQRVQLKLSNVGDFGGQQRRQIPYASTTVSQLAIAEQPWYVPPFIMP